MHAAFIDTDLARRVPAAKIAPQDVVSQALTALEAGQVALLADATSRGVHAGLVGVPRVYAGLGVAP